MKEVTVKEFQKMINKANAEEKRFTATSIDSGGVCVNLVECKIEVSMEDGVGGEICMFKPYSLMEVTIDLEVVDSISEEEGTYYIEMNNDSPDISVEIYTI